MHVRLLLPLTLVLAFVVLAPSRAEAGIVLITRGDSVKHLGDVVPERRAEVRAATGKDDVKVGYVYRYFGVFWVDFWTWDGKYALYKDRTFWKLEPEEAAALMGTTVDKLGKPFFYRVPPGLIVLALVGLLIAWGWIASMRDDRRRKTLLAHDRYVRALEIVRAAAQASWSRLTPPRKARVAGRTSRHPQ
jgi:hypothetical protein